MSDIKNCQEKLKLTFFDKTTSFFDEGKTQRKIYDAKEKISALSICIEDLNNIGIVVDCKISDELFWSQLVT